MHIFADAFKAGALFTDITDRFSFLVILRLKETLAEKMFIFKRKMKEIKCETSQT